MVKKRKLNIEYETEFNVFGIYSTLKDYRFCWMLNKHLDFDIKRIADFLYIPHKATEPASFPVFAYEKPELLIHHFLIVNKCSRGYLFHEPRNMDYLLVVKNPQINTAEFINNLRKIPMVMAVFSINEKQNNRTTTVMYDFELFLAKVLDKK